MVVSWVSIPNNILFPGKNLAVQNGIATDQPACVFADANTVQMENQLLTK